MPVLFRSQETINKLRPRIPKDVYQTPPKLASAVIDWIADNFAIWSGYKYSFLDPGAGSGVWGKAVRQRFIRAKITGLDIRRLKKPGEYDYWHKTDFVGEERAATGRFDFVVGNPPFIQAEEFISRGLDTLGQNGVLAYLLPADFLHSEKRGRGLFTDRPPMTVLSLMQRPNFAGPKGESLGKANTDNYVVGIWRANSSRPPFTTLSWLDWK